MSTITRIKGITLFRGRSIRRADGSNFYQAQATPAPARAERPDSELYEIETELKNLEATRRARDLKDYDDVHRTPKYSPTRSQKRMAGQDRRDTRERAAL